MAAINYHPRWLLLLPVYTEGRVYVISCGWFAAGPKSGRRVITGGGGGGGGGRGVVEGKCEELQPTCCGTPRAFTVGPNRVVAPLTQVRL